jgi:cold shock CspA family protein
VEKKHPGVILFYLADKGYGYLRLAGTQEEFHFQTKNMLQPTLRKGDLVHFCLRQGRQGYYADEIGRAGIA